MSATSAPVPPSARSEATAVTFAAEGCIGFAGRRQAERPQPLTTEIAVAQAPHVRDDGQMTAFCAEAEPFEHRAAVKRW